MSTLRGGVFTVLLLFGSVAQGEVRLAVMGPPGVDLGGLVPLVEVALGKIADVTLVDRESITAVLKEQQLQAACAVGAASERIQLGRILRADILVLLRPRAEPKPHVEAIVCETKQGIRLPVAPLPRDMQVAEQASIVGELAQRAIATRDFSHLVAVPPLVNNSLTRELDHFQAAYARLIEESLAGRDKLAVIELAEAKAIAGELGLTGGDKVVRQLPFYLEGEFRGEGFDDKCRVAFTLRLMHGSKQLAERTENNLEPGKVGAALCAAAGAMLDESIGRSSTAFDLQGETKRLEPIIAAHLAIGNWNEALTLAEASLLIDPEQPKVHGYALTIMAMDIHRRTPRPIERNTGNMSPLVPLMVATLPHIEGAIKAEIPSSQTWGARTFWWPERNSVGSQKAKNDLKKILGETTYRQWLSFHERLRIVAGRAMDRKAAAKVDDDSFRVLHPWLISDNFSEKPISDSVAYFQACCDERYALATKFRYLRKATCDFGAFVCPKDWLTSVRDDDERAAMYKVFWKYMDDLEALDAAWMTAFVKNEKKIWLPRGVPKYMDTRGPWDDHRLVPGAPPPGHDNKAFALDHPDARFIPMESFSVEREGRVKTVSANYLKIETWMEIQDGLELVITRSNVYLMKHKGILREIPVTFSRLWANDGDTRSPGNPNFCWDGHYVWGVSPSNSRQFLVAIDPTTEQVWTVDADHGLPPMNKERGAAITAVAPGKTIVAGYFGRSWIASANLDPEKGISFDVFHEARVVELPTAQDGRTDVTLSIDFARAPQAMFTVKDFDAPPGVTRPLVLVDQRDKLCIDPDTRQIRVIDWRTSDLIQSPELRKNVMKHFKHFGDFFEDLVLPQTSSIDRSERVWKDQDPVKGRTPFQAAALEHDGRYYWIESPRATHGYRLFTGGPTDKNGQLMKVWFPRDVHDKPLLFRSRHYGLILRFKDLFRMEPKVEDK